MSFELTDALVDELLFCMEDQEGEFLVDTQEGVVIGPGAGFEARDAGTDRCIPLPGWESSDGYRLMERFAAAFRNPLIRGELTGALNQGKGVFRAFKDTLARYPEVEKRWFAFKEREMKREILRWYNGLREEWGLARIGGEPEETGDLLLEDFRFRPGKDRDTAGAGELHRRLREEQGEIPGGETVPWAFPGDFSLVAETGNGEFVGYLAAVWQGDTLCVRALEVRAEYQGLGIGEALVSRFVEAARERSAPGIALDLPALAEGFSRVLLRESFKPWVTRYYLSLRECPEERSD
jgi:GNAT superfamily N-acetyltransferase